LTSLRGAGAGILAKIDEKKALDKDLEKEIGDFLGSFTNSYILRLVP
jgi:hypothetical protein